MESTTNTKAYWAVFAVCIIWGTTFMQSKIGLRYLPPLQLSGIRQILAGAMFLGYFAFRKMPLPNGKQLLRLAVLSFFFLVLSNGLTVWSLKYMSSGIGAIAGSIVPLWIALLGWMFRGKTLNRVSAIGMLLGFLGIMLVFYNDFRMLFDPAERSTHFGLGLLLSMIATLAWSIGTIYNAEPDTTMNPFYSLGWQMFLSGIILLIGAYGIETTVPLTEIDLRAWGAIAYLIVFGSIGAFVAYIYALKRLPTAQVAIYAYINPIIAVLLGWWLLDEHVSVFLLAGGVVTLFGVYLVNRGFRKG